MYEFLHKHMSANETRVAQNLSERLPWTCDLRMAKDPEDTDTYFYDHFPRNTKYVHEWGVAIDHCWVVSSNAKEVRNSSCDVVSLKASDHLGLAIEINRD